MAYRVCVSIPENMSAPRDGFIKHVEFYGEGAYRVSYKKLEKTLFLEYMKQHEALSYERIMTVTFKTQTSSFCVKVLQTGIFCMERYYYFLGYSESQLIEKTCYMMDISERELHDHLLKFGADFYQIEDPLLRTRRFSLLFATFDNLLQIRKDDVIVKPDLKSRFKRHIFTSGCGFMYPQFHSKLRSHLQARYPEPSAALVRYQGFEGMLVLKEVHTNVSHQVQFHESMEKFVIPEAMRDAISFICIVDYSKPHENGYLDNLLIMLLISRGVSVEHIRNLQEGYLNLLKAMCKDESSASYFLGLTGRSKCLNEKLLTDLRNEEIKKMFNFVDHLKHERPGNRVSRTHILVPKARVVFGVCDPYDELMYDECYFKPTLLHAESEEFARTNKVIVVCIPCYHPGDIRVLKLTQGKSRYENLTDCLVLPVKGPRSHAFECGGSNLGGTKFFVSWDVSLIPKENVEPCSYFPSTRERINQAWAKFCSIVHGFRSSPKSVKESQEEMIYHFARFVDNLPNRIDQTYESFAKALGPSSEECKQLSKMFYQATHFTVDVTVLQERLAKEFKPREPATGPRTFSGDQSPTERSFLLEEEDEGRNNEGLFYQLFVQLRNRLSSCRRKPSSGPDYEALWNEFDERTARFVEEMAQGQDFH